MGRTEQFAWWNVRRQGKCRWINRRSAERALSRCGQPFSVRSPCGGVAASALIHTRHGGCGGDTLCNGLSARFPVRTFAHRGSASRLSVHVARGEGPSRRASRRNGRRGPAGPELPAFAGSDSETRGCNPHSIRHPQAHLLASSHTQTLKEGKWVCPAPEKGLVSISFPSVSKGVVSERKGIRRKLENNQRSSGQRSCVNAALGSMNRRSLWLVVPSRMDSCCSPHVAAAWRGPGALWAGDAQGFSLENSKVPERLNRWLFGMSLRRRFSFKLFF